MPETCFETEVGVTGEVFELNRAVLFYKTSHYSGGSFATVHDVVKGKIQPGEAIDMKAYRAMLDSGKSRAPIDWVHPGTIAQGPGFVAWWVPPKERVVFFGGDSKREAQKERLPFPAMLFVAGTSRRSLFCFISKAETLSLDSPVCPSRMSNTYADGGVCLGSMNVGRLTPADWEAGFFSSAFYKKPQFHYAKNTKTVRSTIDHLAARFSTPD